MSNSACAFRVAPALAIALGLLLFGSGPVPAAAATNTHTVNIDGARFDPETITVKAGDTIVWVNKDPFPHTATSQAGRFDSGIITTDKYWTYTQKPKGDFASTCTLHLTMNAMLRVE